MTELVDRLLTSQLNKKVLNLVKKYVGNQFEVTMGTTKENEYLVYKIKVTSNNPNNLKFLNDELELNNELVLDIPSNQISEIKIDKVETTGMELSNILGKHSVPLSYVGADLNANKLRDIVNTLESRGDRDGL
jgi:hypothetical protein